MSAFLVKEKVLNWLYERYVVLQDEPYMLMIREVESGRFDWSSEGE